MRVVCAQGSDPEGLVFFPALTLWGICRVRWTGTRLPCLDLDEGGQQMSFCIK